MLPGHELNRELAGTERFRLLRMRRSLDGLPVLVKAPRHNPARAIDIEALRRELRLGLPVAGVLRPLEPDLLQGHASVYADPGGVALDCLLEGARSDLGLTLAIGIEIGKVLEPIHRLGIVHHGIRPDAVLFDPAQPGVCLVDLTAATGGAAGVGALPAQSLPPAQLAYASPEQTGRLNRVTDYRSDFYALGVLLYELLTGAPPFRSNDALELIHWHIARTPPAPADLDPEIPAAVSDIVMKLLAKTPEERYQNALGLCDDLRTCAREWAARRRIDPFPLGRRDVSDHFLVSQKLYGREQEVAVLLDAFERGCRVRGAPASMVLVAGYSGIGKTALIQELYKPIVRREGYFVSGKFDQVVRNIPFGALIQAFRGLLRQLLTESEARLAAWRDSLARALGANVSVLAEVIPEIELIAGKQPPPVPLGPTEARNRFQLAFQNFAAAVARPEHPLVVFLDDLQWADAATLSLLEPLLASRDIQSLLLLGAYRDNEVDAAHGLMRTLSALESAGVRLERLALGPLELPDLSRLIGDTLRSDLEHAEPLARLVQAKTGGNPFFVTQFLGMLAQEGYLKFDYSRARWTYDIATVTGAPFTENVIDLMTLKIQRLSGTARHVLTLAACIGDPFDRDTLATVCEERPEAVAHDLEQGINEGLIVPTGARFEAGQSGDAEAAVSAYSFLHDRVQQSAYALIPAERRHGVHLAVGRLLLSRTTSEQTDEKLFDIVHHLNLGRELITAPAERLATAQLNLSAGRKAKSATAYAAALAYLHAGLDLLDPERWDSDYDLAFALHLEGAEAAYLCADFDCAERLFAALREHVATRLDEARVHRLRSVQYEYMGRYADALSSAREGLALFGVAWPDSPVERETALEREMATIQSLLGGRSIASLLELPIMVDLEVRMVMHILTDIWSSAYILGGGVLARLISATMVRLSLEHGNAEESAYGYVTHAITVGPVRADYASAYEFGTLALKVNERFNDSRRRAKIYQQFHAHVNFWRQPMRTCLPYAREACRSGLESGDFLYAAYGAATETWWALLASDDLAQFVRDYSPSVALLARLKNTGFCDSLKIILNWARALQGKTRSPLSLSDTSIDEEVYLQTYRDHPFFRTFLAVAKLQLCCLFGDYRKALDAAREARVTVHQLDGTVWPVIFEFWNGLTLAAAHGDTCVDDRDRCLVELERSRDAFEVLAANCPENFRCQWLLLCAEFERVSDRPLCALDFYDRAIDSAKDCGMLQYRGLAEERSASLRLARGQVEAGALFLDAARDCYDRWGAAAKVVQLDRVYPELCSRKAAPVGATPAAHTAPPAGVALNDTLAAGGFDLLSIMKSTRAIAGEIELEQLLAKLLRIGIENAGAEKGSLLLESEDDSVVRAEGSLDAVEVSLQEGVASERGGDLPATIVNFVRRTLEAVVVDDAHADDRYSADPYIQLHRPRSVMCLPVLLQRRLVGVLYLENTMIRGAFTPERIQILQVLSTEAAISLENAKLVDGLRREIRKRSEAQEKLRAALGEVERLKNELEAENVYLRRDLIANVSHDLRTPLASLRGHLETLMMKEESLPDAKRRRYLEIATRQSVHLANLVDELFELAKLDFKGTQINCELLHLGELARDVMQKFQLAADRKAVSLTVEVPSAIPFARADASLLERVFENLIANALKHTPAGGRVVVKVLAQGERVMVRVADTGSGIPEPELPHIFNRFYRVDKSRSSASGGAGLGLAITKRILELHQSPITVESKADVGTCFTFSLAAEASA